ncbi:MAG TPA: exodeoxyribonuclease VII large subunit [Synergistaceae bacterium]|nr:exodeoxyribonuclease VII large subunit [Synergistaceae bacterium]
MGRTPLPLSVEEVTRQIVSLLEESEPLQNLVVRGEIREIHRHRSGHTYFTLGDDHAVLAGVLFKGESWRQIYSPLVGDEVFVEGRIGVYPARGSYQLYARRFLPLGKGAKARARAMVEEKLRKEGLFDLRIKRTFPPFPEHVGIITAPGGAAVRDVLAVAGRRFPRSRLYVLPALVQGAGAVSSVLHALEILRALPNLQAAMLVRGGGAKDELSPFDDEELVRAVRLSPVPLVTGIGHERDLSLADLAADAHASTPSAAAEFLFPHREDLLLSLEQYRRRFSALWKRKAERKKLEMDHAAKVLYERFVRRRIPRELQREEECEKRLSQAFIRSLEEWKRRLQRAEEHLQAKAPQKILARGYVFCSTSEGIPLASVKDLEEGKTIQLHFADGSAQVQVLHVYGSSLLEG